MESTVNAQRGHQYPKGTVIEFIEHDRYQDCYQQEEKRYLTIGHHYIVEEFDEYTRKGYEANDESLVLFYVGNNTPIALYPYQFRVVKPVQKHTFHFQGFNDEYLTNGHHYEIEERYLVGVLFNVQGGGSLAALENEISGFTINNTGEL